MANAIPVNADPTPKKVKVAPATDQNGVAMPAEYATSGSANLGTPEDFVSKGVPRQLTSHDAVRVDN